MANLISRLVRAYCGVNIVLRILCGLAVGIVLACALLGCRAIGLLGVLFVGTLKAIAPILVALLFTSSLASGSLGLNSKRRGQTPRNADFSGHLWLHSIASMEYREK